MTRLTILRGIMVQGHNSTWKCDLSSLSSREYSCWLELQKYFDMSKDHENGYLKVKQAVREKQLYKIQRWVKILSVGRVIIWAVPLENLRLCQNFWFYLKWLVMFFIISSLNYTYFSLSKGLEKVWRQVLSGQSQIGPELVCS